MTVLYPPMFYDHLILRPCYTAPEAINHNTFVIHTVAL